MTLVFTSQVLDVCSADSKVLDQFYGQTTSKSSSSVENRVSGIINTLTTSKKPHVTHMPTLTGGIGAEELRCFYADYFIPSNPPSLRLRLLSRTVGVDRVVDELYVSFQHSQVMSWILPGIPATNNMVEVVVVSIVCMRGGKLYHEHVYWDQASVLVQVGLLDPKMVPESMKKEGVRSLPVVGREAARSILDGSDREEEARNALIPGLGKKASAGVKAVDQVEDESRKVEKQKRKVESEEEIEAEADDEAEGELETEEDDEMEGEAETEEDDDVDEEGEIEEEEQEKGPP